MSEIPMPEQTELPLAADLLHGVRAIAEFIGVDERQAHWQIRQKHIPVARLGRLIVGSKHQLREHLTPKPIEREQASKHAHTLNRSSA
jgi:hypothetical protein